MSTVGGEAKQHKSRDCGATVSLRIVMGSIRLYNNKKESQSVGLTGEAHEQTEIRRNAMEMPRQMEALWCRTFQCVLKLGNCFMGYSSKNALSRMWQTGALPTLTALWKHSLERMVS